MDDGAEPPNESDDPNDESTGDIDAEDDEAGHDAVEEELNASEDLELSCTWVQFTLVLMWVLPVHRFVVVMGHCG